ncbi:MAG TPA: hypothetical protein VGR13_03740, partial [Actinomycetota bacterium]|nr:hypothetical protein [Actinomycetota bacterium]
LDLNSATESDIVSYVNSLKPKGSARGLALKAFHSYYGWAEGENITVNQHDGRTLSHLRALRHEGGAVNVEPQPCPVHLEMHPIPSPARPHREWNGPARQGLRGGS